MELDVNTLFLVTIYVEAMLGLLLLFAWIQNSGIHAVAWWGCAHLLRAASVVLFGMYGSVPDAISIDLANAILFTAFAVTWSGARVFDGRAPEPMYLVGGAVLWLLAQPHSVLRRLDGRQGAARRPASSLPTPGPRPMSSGAAAASRWSRAGPRSSCCSPTARCSCCARRSRKPCLGRRPAGARQRLAHGAELRGAAVHHRDRLHPAGDGERAHRAAPQNRALIDPLTGIANRRAFLEDVIALSQRQEAHAAPSRSCSPISTTSSRSTIASAMRSATMCCRFSPRAASAKLGPSI